MTYVKKVIEKGFKIKRANSIYVASSALMAVRTGDGMETDSDLVGRKCRTANQAESFTSLRRSLRHTVTSMTEAIPVLRSAHFVVWGLLRPAAHANASTRKDESSIKQKNTRILFTLTGDP